LYWADPTRTGSGAGWNFLELMHWNPIVVNSESPTLEVFIGPSFFINGKTSIDAFTLLLHSFCSTGV
jgi:hypothetical protein